MFYLFFCNLDNMIIVRKQIESKLQKRLMQVLKSENFYKLHLIHSYNSKVQYQKVSHTYGFCIHVVPHLQL